ncbi:pentapeptide repeat-containing protein [Aquimarina sp. 2201CG14-23]|uniref:pentapeptide repeat-containing protein n=1 Tax=Aquimarina mycalae TaxID=3040073 RepID=UPI002477F92F|nr:pentapeptide repeat-containing protein [Aquimarina sp. 2201CG14-23]MDH7445289.1 pentapeptide repeat-containing protein [Aquimarina sp. 2201CG14-23]
MTEQERIEQLEQEKQQLQDQLDQIKKRKEKKKSIGFWLLKKSSVPLLGVRLKKSINNAITEYKETKSVSVDTVSDVSSNVIWRITRIGIFGLLVTLIPSIILLYQTKLVINQNRLVDNQNELIEAERRSSLVFIMDNLLSDLSEELKYKGSSERNISPVLEARIASLSRAMKPYKYKEDGELIDKKISPEKGQLLFSLIRSNLADQSYREILDASDFSYTFFKDIYLGRGVNMKYINLSHSNLSEVNLPAANLERSELTEANMEQINLSDAVLVRANLTNANLRNSELLSVDLTNAKLYGADLTEADLTEATLWGTKLEDAVLTDVVLDNAIVHRQDWISYVADSLDLKGANAIKDNYRVKKQGKQQFVIVPR